MEENNQYNSPNEEQIDIPSDLSDSDLTVDYEPPETWMSLAPIHFSNFDVSSHGNIRNSITMLLVRPSIMRETAKHRVTVYVYLVNDFQSRYKLTIARLVVMAFNSSLPKNFIVRHKDMDNTNNKLENLEVKSIKKC